MTEQEIKTEVSVLHSILLAKGYKWAGATAYIAGASQLPSVLITSQQPRISEALSGSTMRDALDAAASYVNALSIAQVAA
ncbi:hypothetical protein [Brucella pseudogrignonensis]|uniref:Uncharacterized protein n=1 Tax=Brucella pseudogrignonensis TaxID=419475 RepID=A0ABU1M7V5_9HYPH|nr:hypothetical protein [Brucella pseudogrignonensis]MDR6431988.1 hypothetical protein [Brucella pseudogrignonensis]